jgi:hypothetical protein
VPIAHGEQVSFELAPKATLAEPGGQELHVVAALALRTLDHVPLGHNVQPATDATPTSSDHVPAGHD